MPPKTRYTKYLSIIVFNLSFIVVFSLGGFAFLSREITILREVEDELHRDLNYIKTSQTSDKNNLNKQLVLLREELIKYKSQQEGRDQILGLAAINQTSIAATSSATARLPTPTPLAQNPIKGIVQLKNDWQTADVFQEAKASSKIIGQIVKDKLYFIYEINGAWYKIDYNLNLQGWIQSSVIDKF